MRVRCTPCFFRVGDFTEVLRKITYRESTMIQVTESSAFLSKYELVGVYTYCDEILRRPFFKVHIENWVSSQNINDSSIILGWNWTSKDRLIATLARIYKERPSRHSEGIIIIIIILLLLLLLLHGTNNRVFPFQKLSYYEIFSLNPTAGERWTTWRVMMRRSEPTGNSTAPRLSFEHQFLHVEEGCKLFWFPEYFAERIFSPCGQESPLFQDITI